MWPRTRMCLLWLVAIAAVYIVWTQSVAPTWLAWSWVAACTGLAVWATAMYEIAMRRRRRWEGGDYRH